MLKNIVEDTKRILMLEEKGISAEVQDALSLLLTALKENMATYGRSSQNQTVYWQNFDIDLFGGFKITVECFINIFTQNSGQIPEKEFKYNTQDKVISINYKTVLPKFNPNNINFDECPGFVSGLSHELKHAYQHLKIQRNRNDDKSDLLNYKEQNVYNMALDVQNMNHKKGTLDKYVASLIYYTNPSEITAFQEALYTEGKTVEYNQISHYIYESSMAKIYKKIDMMLTTVLNSGCNEDSNLNKHLQYVYNRNVIWFVKRLKKGLQRYDKALKDTEKLLKKRLTSTVNENYTPDYWNEIMESLKLIL